MFEFLFSGLNGAVMACEDDVVDLRGRVVIVTGGNTGVGYGTAQALFRKGAKVYVAARSEARAREAIEQMKREEEERVMKSETKKSEMKSLSERGDNGTGVGVGSKVISISTQASTLGSLEWLDLDLSDPRLAKKAAEEFMRREERLDVLVNNAARGGYGPFSFDKDGLLDIMVTNHISPYVFTRTLLPLLKKTAAEPNSDVRIVNVTSIAHTRVHPTTFKGKEAVNKDYGTSVPQCIDTYGHSKLANILHMKDLQRILDGATSTAGTSTTDPARYSVSDTDTVDSGSSHTASNIICISVHPGTIKTKGTDAFFDSVPYIAPIVKFVGGLVFGSWESGGMTVAWAAAGRVVGPGEREGEREREKYKGAYVVPGKKVVEPSVEAGDERLGRELRESTEEILRALGV